MEAKDRFHEARLGALGAGSLVSNNGQRMTEIRASRASRAAAPNSAVHPLAHASGFDSVPRCGEKK